MPGIFLHPGGQPAALKFPACPLPRLKQGQRLYLFSFVGLRDGVPWEGEGGRTPNGVTFQIKQNGTVLLERRQVQGAGWRFMGADITHLQGREVVFTLHTDACGNSNWDWAVFGRPMVCLLDQLDATLRFSNGVCAVDLTDKLPLLATGNVPASSLQETGAQAKRCFLLTADGIRIRQAEDASARPFHFIAPARLPAKICLPQASDGILRLWSFPPQLQVTAAGSTCPLPLAGTQTDLFVSIANRGYGTSAKDKKVSVDVKGNGSFTRALPVVKPGEEVCMRMGRIRLPASDELSVTVRAGDGTFTSHCPVLPHSTASFSLSGVTSDLIFFAHGSQVLYASLRAKGEAVPYAYLMPLASLSRDGSTPKPLALSLKEMTAEGAVLESVQPDCVIRQVWKSDGDRFRFEMHLAPERHFSFHHFGGPVVKWTGGKGGPGHDFAILPGVEYLDSGDHSSSMLLADPPLHDHHVPHPYDLAAGCAAISRCDFALALLWDQKQSWYGDNQMPLLFFDVPERGADRDYAQMQLFVPSVEQGVPENSVVSRAPFTVTKPVSLEGTILAARRRSPDLVSISETVRKGDLVLACLKRYFEQFDAIEPQKPPRGFEEVKKLSRIGWLRSVYVPGEGTRHCIGDRWKPAPTPGVFTLLLLDAFDTGDAEGAKLYEQVKQWSQDAVKERGAAYLASRTNCHILGGEYPFYYGHIEDALSAWKMSLKGLQARLVNGFGPPWHPGGDELRKRLGRPGQLTGGNTARSAWLLAYFARVTGDEKIERAARRTLDCLETYRVPRGAQGWECPLHCPDILTSAYAVKACVDFYRITGEKEYLDRARYWAWTGLPFVYSWGLDHIPSMEGNTTPILGTTFFNHSWIGLPVVWCGLVYSYGLYHLAAVLGDEGDREEKDRWQRIARAVTISSEHQQFAEPGPRQGTYPDSFSLKLNRRNPAYIHPEDIMVNAWMDRGMDPGVKTKIVHCDGERIHISSGAWFDSVRRSGKTIKVQLRWFPGKKVQLFVGGRSGPLRIQQVETLDGKDTHELKPVSISDPKGYGVEIQANEQGAVFLEMTLLDDA